MESRSDWHFLVVEMSHDVYVLVCTLYTYSHSDIGYCICRVFNEQSPQLQQL